MRTASRNLWIWSCLLLLFALPAAAPQAGPDGERLAGQLLVAAPDMGDPRFAESVIYMIEHDESGALGLVVNQPLGEASARRLLEKLGEAPPLPEATIRVYSGGPVDPGRGFVLHSDDKLFDDSLALDNGLAVTNDPAMLRAIAAGEGPRKALFMLGYSGWGPGQLEAEMAAGAWISVPLDKALLFEDADAEKWTHARDHEGMEL